MPRKRSTEGFIKGLQRTKFIRHRDVKLKESEIKKEHNIQRAMCEGICARCREKVQWRFQYDKYKPLKNVATCQGCKQKCVTKAYRTLCDMCASQRKACASCCGDLTALIQDDITRKQEGSITDTEPIIQEIAHDRNNNEKADIDSEYDKASIKKESISEESVMDEGSDKLSWRENEYINVMSSKYSKHRQVGTVQDSVFAFKVVNEAKLR